MNYCYVFSISTNVVVIFTRQKSSRRNHRSSVPLEIPSAASTNRTSGGKLLNKLGLFTNALHIFCAMPVMLLISSNRKMMGGPGRYHLES